MSALLEIHCYVAEAVKVILEAGFDTKLLSPEYEVIIQEDIKKYAKKWLTEFILL